MMKKLQWLVAALAVAAISSGAQAVPKSAAKPAPKAASKPVAKAKAPAKPLPVFSFSGTDTETVYDLSAMKGCDKPKSDGTLTCTDTKATVAGKETIFVMKKYNKDGKFFLLMSYFRDWAYDDISKAFTEKYGAPTVAVRDWQNRAGSVFKNTVSVWHFKGGDLELHSMGSSTDNGSFEFISVPNSPPEEPAKVDF